MIGWGYTSIMDPLVFEIAKNVDKSVDNITKLPCEILQPGSLYLTAGKDDLIQTGNSWTTDMSQKAASGKADW